MLVIVSASAAGLYRPGMYDVNLMPIVLGIAFIVIAVVIVRNRRHG